MIVEVVVCMQTRSGCYFPLEFSYSNMSPEDAIQRVMHIVSTEYACYRFIDVRVNVIK